MQMLETDQVYYRYEEEVKKSSRMEIDHRNSHIEVSTILLTEPFFSSFIKRLMSYFSVN
jgi:hypothetical protein